MLHQGVVGIGLEEEGLARLEKRKRLGDDPPKLLLEVGAEGGFSAATYDALRSDPGLIDELAAG